MISKLVSSLFIGLVFFSITSCDTLPNPTGFQESSQLLKSLTFESDTLSFKNSNALKDTSIQFSVSVEVSDTDLLGENPVASIYDKLGYTVVHSDTLIQTDKSIPVFTGKLMFSTNTGLSSTAVIIVSAKTLGGNPTNFIRRSLPIEGFSIPPATVVQIIAPDTIKIPTTGSTSFLIGAEVTHPIKQAYIKRVLLELISNTTGSLGTFRLYDDGSLSNTPEGTISGDQHLNDGIYSSLFSISSGNSPDIITIIIKAIDTSDNESNTLTKTLTIAQ